MKQVKWVPKKSVLTSALLLAMTAPAWAQQTDQTTNTQSGQADATELDSVVVTGIRSSLEASMNLKRDAQGIVDGITAEDIGKFPDTNLAEALQRISGVSIDRQLGEGSKVTVRGVGPDFNLVLLNGRQMPAANLGSGGAGTTNSRSFDFANLAAEAVSAIEVFKTSRADKPTGGIGATLDVRTARPLDHDGMVASVGVKAMHDTTVDNLPRSFEGESITPEISGIFSNTFADGKFGIGLSASYQERDFGFSQASVANGWAKFRGDDTTSWNRLPQPGDPNYDLITHRPGSNDVYSRPQNTGYSVNGVQRQRTNGQLVLQYAPTDRITMTADYTYAENKVQQQRSELSVWFNFQPGPSSWTDGPVSAPISYSEFTSGTADVAMGGAQFATRSELKSTGFNVEWEVNDALDLAFDYHNSEQETLPDSPYGSAGVLAVAAFVRGTTTVDYSRDLPIVHYELPAGVSQVEASQALVTGSVFHNSYSKSEVEQGQINGKFKFGEYSALDFGIASTEVQNRTAYGYTQRDTWGGVGTPEDYEDDIWYADNMSNYFGSFYNSNDPRWTDRFLVFDFERLRARAAQVGDPACPSCYVAPSVYTRDLRSKEKSRSAFLQYSTTWDWSIPVHFAAGIRYEKTEVTSNALVPTATSIRWGSANEFNVNFADPAFGEAKGEYDYWLPSIDFKADLREDLILRASYGHTIGRPGWQDIQGGQTLNQQGSVSGGTGQQGNPNLEPLLSKNFDVSFEWYYGEGSFLSAGYFRKNIDNYIGTTEVIDTPYDLHTPVGGAYWNEALSAGGCAATDMVCIRNYIFRNHAGDPGVIHTGTNQAGEETGDIIGQPGDPIATFRITTPANQKSASLDGWEFNLQHMIEDTGFGIAANYTIVNSSLTYDNYNLGEQFALEGLSDSANIVGFYDKDKWQVRLAYNWRDKFLSGRFDGQGANPNYTEPYGQLDASISYQFSENLSVSFEGINLTDETVRIHGRNKNQVLWLTQGGPRYGMGVRYKF